MDIRIEFMEMSVKNKSLRECITISDEVNTLIKQWTLPKLHDKVLLLVEGNEDRDFLYRFVDNEVCEIKCCQGCSNLESIYRNLKKRSNIMLCLAIRDADFLRINGIKPDDGIFYTDAHDHDMMCIACSDCLCDLFLGLGAEYNDGIKDSIYGDLKNLSYIKWYVWNNRLSYRFDDVNVIEMGKKDLKDLGHLIKEIQKQSPNGAGLSVEVIKEFIKDKDGCDVCEITNGHDFLQRAIFYLSNYGIRRKEWQIRDLIHAHFRYIFFAKTNLYKSIVKWESINGRKILRKAKV